MKLSIVVPAYNAEETLGQCLTAISTVIAGRQDCEVIVVDDGSTDQTAAIAQRFPIRLLRLARNQGRIQAREQGVRTAKADTILLVDSRILLPPDALNTLEQLDYEPVMGSVVTPPNQDDTALDRLLYLIRKWLYAPYYPQPESDPIIRITPQNFDRVPKGLGAFYIDKSRFLQVLPTERSRYVNDDVRILSTIVHQKEIWVPRHFPVVYVQGRRPRDAFRHLYERGPRFADFHLQPGGKYHPFWIACCLLMLTAMAGAVWLPPVAMGIAALSLLSLLVISVRLAENLADVVTVFAMLPVVAVFFGLGILKGKYRQFLKAPAHIWNRRLALMLVAVAAILVYFLNKSIFQNLRVTRWELLPLLTGIHLAFLAINGAVLKTFLKLFEVRLRPTECFGLAVMTSLGSYFASGIGGMALRAAVLKRKFDVSYTHFLAVLTSNYLVNVLLAAVLGLGICAILYATETTFRVWELPVFFAAVGGVAVALAVFRPSLPMRQGRIQKRLEQIYAGWDMLLQRPTILGKVGILLFLNVVLKTLELMVGFAMFSVSLDELTGFLMAVLSSFSIFLALTPANLGIQEGITAFIAHLVGYGLHYGLAVAAISRAVAMANVFVLGPIFSYLLLKERA